MSSFPPLYVLVLLPLAAATLGSFLPRRWYQLWLAVVHVTLLGLAVWLLVLVRSGGPVRYLMAGWPEGVAIKLIAGTLSTPLVLLTAIFCAGLFFFFDQGRLHGPDVHVPVHAAGNLAFGYLFKR